MSAIDSIGSLDAFIANAKREFEDEKTALLAKAEADKQVLIAGYEKEIQGLKDSILAASIQVEVHKNLMNDAHAARAKAEQVTTTLLTQFGTISETFDKIRAFASNISSGVKTIESKVEAIPSEAHTAVATATAAIEKALHGS